MYRGLLPELVGMTPTRSAMVCMWRVFVMCCVCVCVCVGYAAINTQTHIFTHSHTHIHTHALQYAGFDVSKRFLSASMPLSDRGVAALAGGIAGLPEALATTPFQVKLNAKT